MIIFTCRNCEKPIYTSASAYGPNPLEIRCRCKATYRIRLEKTAAGEPQPCHHLKVRIYSDDNQQCDKCGTWIKGGPVTT